jgi:hypothetical protein
MKDQHGEMDFNGMHCENDGPEPIIAAGRLLKPVFIIAAATVALLTAGCTDVGGQLASKRKSALGDNPQTYFALKPSMPPPAAGSGRLIVYFPDGGPSPRNELGNADLCTIDENLYDILGATYWYLDLPAGEHTITAGGIISFYHLGLHVGRGKTVLEFMLAARETKYCRINLRGDATAIYLPLALTMVEASTAERELANLVFYPNFETGKTAK